MHLQCLSSQAKQKPQHYMPGCNAFSNGYASIVLSRTRALHALTNNCCESTARWKENNHSVLGQGFVKKRTVSRANLTSKSGFKISPNGWKQHLWTLHEEHHGLFLQHFVKWPDASVTSTLGVTEAFTCRTAEKSKPMVLIGKKKNNSGTPSKQFSGQLRVTQANAASSCPTNLHFLPSGPHNS